MKVIGYISLELTGCDIEDEIDIPDQELEDITEEQRDEIIEDYVKEQVFQHVDWGWKLK